MKYMNLNQILQNEKYPFTKGQMRAFLLKRESNGLEKCIRKIGMRVYFREDLFDEWIENQAESPHIWD